MISRKLIYDIFASYNLNDLSIASLGSHSALDIARGAKDEGFRSVVVAKKVRENTYTKYLRTRNRGGYAIGCVDEAIVVNNWEDMCKNPKLEKLRQLNSIVVANRALEVYLKHRLIQESLKVPLFGFSRKLLEAEERGPGKLKKNQDYMMKAASILTPGKYSSPKEIDGPVIVKANYGLGERYFERNFFIVKSSEEYEAKVKEIISRVRSKREKKILEDNLRNAVIEEYIRGPKVNMNYFYSAIHDELEFMGTDTRLQFPSGEEAAHIPASPRESSYEEIYEMGERLVKIARKEFPPGIVGPFSLQCVGDKKGRWRTYDLSLRIPGSPDIGITPPVHYLYGSSRGRIDFGRRIAMEIKDAMKQDRLKELIS